jgi:hypothetical protein
MRNKKMKMPSFSRKSQAKKPRLLSRAAVERFLEDCANLKADPHSKAAAAALEKFQQRFPEIFESLESPEALLWIGDALSMAWEPHTEWEREWYLTHAQCLSHMETASPPPPPPEPSALEQALLHFRQNIRRALICRNSRCQTPYFIAREKGQKYCSKKCSALGNRKTKLDWWNENRRGKAGKSKSQPKRRPEPSSVQPTQPKKGKS